MTLYSINTGDHIAHHGRQGQKWGVRNGPPYPLYRQKSTPAQYKIGNKVKKGPMIAEGTYKIKKYTSPLRKSVKAQILARVPIVGGIQAIKATIDTYKVNSLMKENWEKREGAPEKLSQMKKKTAPTTVEQDMKTVNPYKNKRGGVNNCVNCTVAMEMRRRGYDCIARRSVTGVDITAYRQWFEGAILSEANIPKNKVETRKSYSNRAYNLMCNQIEKYGDGARGAILIEYESVSGFGLGAGHSMFWEVRNGKVEFYDGQSGSQKTDEVFALALPSNYQWIRLDNCKLKPAVTERCRSRS